MAKALGLSSRQAEVLSLMSRGLLAKEVAGRLGISLSTVKKHCQKIYRRTDSSNAREAIWRCRYLNPG